MHPGIRSFHLNGLLLALVNHLRMQSSSPLFDEGKCFDEFGDMMKKLTEQSSVCHC